MGSKRVRSAGFVISLAAILILSQALATSSALASGHLTSNRRSAPAAPSGLTATAVSSSQIGLRWIDNSANEDGFKVERATTSAGPWTQISLTGSSAASYADTGRSALTTYYYRVRATNPYGDSAYSNTASTTTAGTVPASPGGLAASAASSSQISLSWTDNSMNETGFKVERAMSPTGPWTQVGTTATSVSSYFDTGLAPTTTCYYRVRASNAAGDSAYSNAASATTSATAPAAPSALTASAISSSLINLGWTDTSSNETGFKVERATASSGPWTQIGTTGASVASYADSSAAASTTYYYRVRATNAVGDSAYSNVASATTPAAAPTAPSGLTATTISSSQINLGWTDNSSNETGFEIERAASSAGPWSQIGITTSVTYQDSGRSASTAYYYRVRATNTAGDSAYSSVASAITLAAGGGPTFAWQKDYGSTSNHDTAAPAVAVDRNDNAVVAGTFSGTVDFGGGPLLTSVDGCDIFVAKYAPSGAYIWAKQFGIARYGTCTNFVSGVAVDADGTIILAGTFQTTLNFGGSTLTASVKSGYLVKLAADGAHVWSKSFTSSSTDGINAVAVDVSGNIAITGYFRGTVSFGGGSLTSNGTNADPFVAKFSSAGTHLWSQRYGDTDTQLGLSVAFDGAGNVLAAGMFKGSVDFGGGVLTAGVNPLSGPSNDLFLVKFSPSGGHLWSKGIGDTQGQQQVAYDVAADGADNVVLTGTVGGNVNFGGGSTLPIGGQDIFIAKYTPAGGYLWAKRMGASGASDEYASAVTVDSNGNVIVTGYTNGLVDFGGGPLLNLDPVSTNNAFIAKYTPSGDHVWSKSSGDTCDQKGRSVATDSSGAVLASGEFYGTIDFGGGPISSPECLTTDGFLVKLSP